MTMRRANPCNEWLTTKAGIWIVYLALVIFASIQSWSLEPSRNEKNGRYYRHYNNFEIFQSAHRHLLDGKNLYTLYPEEHWDLYKYSPTFALAFGAIAWLPDLAGIMVWNGLNAIVLLLAFLHLPYLDQRKQWLAALIAAPELLTSLQTEQSNGLMAGLMLFTYICLEQGRRGAAAGTVLASGFIKIFGLAALPLFLFHPGKWRSSVAVIAWFIVLLAAPLIILGPQQLLAQYDSWLNVLAMDHAGNTGFSVMGFLKAWFRFEPGGTWITLTGLLMLVAPWLRFRAYDSSEFRRLAIASILVWVVIFNHMAESPTFVIAMTGIALWFVGEKPAPGRVALLGLAILFVTLSPSDIFPASWRREFFRPYVVKVIPCIIIWLVIWWRMIRFAPPSTGRA